MKDLADSNSLLMVVDDSDEDFVALSRIFHLLGLEARVLRCVSGEECLASLNSTGSDQIPAERPLPGMILLDLNLPGMDGSDALIALKTDPILKMIPVTIFTTSANPRDVSACYASGANAYVVKPLNYDDLIETFRIIMDFWLRAAILPTVRN